MELVKEIQIERKSFTDRVAYYAIRPEDEETVDMLNAVLVKNWNAHDFQIMKVDAEDENTGEKLDNCYVVVFHVDFLRYAELQKAFELMLNLKFGDATELLDD